jgi:hypothetical protein
MPNADGRRELPRRRNSGSPTSKNSENANFEELRQREVRRISSCREHFRCPEELGRARDWLEASRQGTQNLVDSYTEMVPKALEVLLSETRHRI